MSDKEDIPVSGEPTKRFGVWDGEFMNRYATAEEVLAATTRLHKQYSITDMGKPVTRAELAAMIKKMKNAGS